MYTGKHIILYNQIFSLIDKSQGTVQAWEWDMGDGNKQTGKQVSYKYPYSEDYKISLKVTDINSCTDTVSKIIHIYDELKIFFPNAFSPNGDALNDTWKPIISDYLKEGYILSIYDRWGQRVFHTTNTEEAWDGTINGKEAEPNTVYSYQVTIKNMAGRILEYTGFVTVVK